MSKNQGSRMVLQKWEMTLQIWETIKKVLLLKSHY